MRRLVLAMSLLLAAAPPARACHHLICFIGDGSSTTGGNAWLDNNAGTTGLGVTLTGAELVFDVPLLVGDGVRGAIGWRKPHWLSMTETVVGGVELAATGALLIAAWAGPAGDGSDGSDPYAGRDVLTALLVIDGVIAGVKLGLGIRGLRRESRPAAPSWSLVPTGNGVFAVGRF